MKKYFLMAVAALTCVANAFASHWNAPAVGTYQGSTEIMIEPMLDGVAMTPEQEIEIAAFIDGECRGVCTTIEALTPNAPTSRYMMQLSVMGNIVETGKAIEFRAYMSGGEYIYTKSAEFDASGLYGYPFELNLLSPASFTGMSLAQSYEVERQKDLDLLSELKFTVKQGGAERTLGALALSSYPAVEWINVNSSNNITLSERGMVYGVASTDATGAPVTAQCGNTLRATTRIVVTPIVQRLDHVSLPASVEVAKGDTRDLKQDLTFYYLSGYDSNNQPTYTELKYNQLSAEVDLSWEISPVAAQSSISVSDDGVVSGLASTDMDGIIVNVTVADAEGSFTHVVVTPISYQITGVSFPESITVGVGETVDVEPLIEFTVIVGRNADGSDKTATRTASQFNAPAITFSGIYAATATVNGTEITGVAGTYQSGDDITINAGESYSKAAKLYVTPFYIPIEDILVKVNGTVTNTLQVVRGTTLDITLEKVPSNATFDLNNVSIAWQACDSTWWNGSAMHEVITSADGSERTLSAYIAGSYKLYMQNEETSQTINEEHQIVLNIGAPIHYAAGWNWISNSVAEQSLTAAEFNAKTGDKVMDLRSQTQTTYKDQTFGFIGRLKQVSWGAYHVQTSAAVDYVLYPTWDQDKVFRSYSASTFYKPWTWFYYPGQFDHEPNEILFAYDEATGENVLMGKVGDRVIGMDNGFAERTATGWICNAGFKLEAGQSYLYYAADGVPQNFKWAREDRVASLPESALFDQNPNGAAERWAEESVWQYDAHRYADNMTIVAAIDCDEELALGAFVGDECRGMGRTVEYDGKRYYFVTIHGMAGEQITFKAYDGNEYADLETRVSFTTMTGSLTNPLQLGTVDTTNGIHTLRADKASTPCYDLSGRRAHQQTPGFVIEAGKGIVVR